MIYQPSLFAHINLIDTMHSEVLKDSHSETAQFWARYMDMIQMVLTLIRATKKTTLNCLSSLSVCLVPNVHCKGSQQLRTICTIYRLQQLELRFVQQIEWCITHHIRAQYIETTLQCTEMKYSICSDAK